EPEIRCVADQVRNLRAPDLVLAREAVDVRTRAADPASLDDGGPMPRSGHVPGQQLPTKSASQDESLVPFSRHRHLPTVVAPMSLPTCREDNSIVLTPSISSQVSGLRHSR